ncbi:pancreatic secretory granule membrane major glycoprotein GP2-like [Hyperolius riggenbachi]|uniref:pancreatic secretory granule membrane major glycoprotein GP2-like n=1 Tax=Hyperolius riggenbachi TaxID=752182 RepID=UPI0035A326F8
MPIEQLTIVDIGCASSCYGGTSPPLCSTCSGSCVASGCKCSNSTSCVPDQGTCSFNTTCCPSSLSWYSTLACCTVDPICSPACLSDEVCQYVNQTATCVANTTYYQSLGLNVYNVTSILTCNGSNMTISVGKNLLEYLHYKPSASTLLQSNCTGAVVSILQGQRVYSLVVNSTIGACGNIMTKNETFVSFTNAINIAGNSDNGLVTAGNLSIQFSCAYNVTMVTSLYTVFHPVATTQDLNSGNTGGEASTTLAAYTNPSYTSPLQTSQQEDLAIGSSLYFGMNTQFPDPAFVLRIEQCFATPTSDGSGTIKVMLISGGCPTGQVPDIQVIENGVSKEVRFSIASFSFQNFDMVYIFCNARLCNSASGTCSSCSSSREVSQNTTQFGLGPFIFVDTQDSSSSTHNGLSFTLLVGSILGLWVLRISEMI